MHALILCGVWAFSHILFLKQSDESIIIVLCALFHYLFYLMDKGTLHAVADTFAHTSDICNLTGKFLQ